ncbi:CG31869 [Drosophila busckii]|uniref:CG31869 n=1 Tax=Drosophila busckii TaxID=30019 RepID=A0A0M4EBB0_DROBS|nr:mucin-5AC [Drosophila busckii]XP_017855275.1 mucin-5AC [Drosophila busckii]XP_017855276.1 mucin-5AC [Drosophila busckii]XP_017855277.1 mucin-5AC [Drosophila busckii]XP_017855278.1 mucin-5AC [Drosophila busckii]XP_017855279.1 mucin-5AC [Drosophila busckii]ALC38685.1 CG31869 [Drosophila busckii]
MHRNETSVGATIQDIEIVTNWQMPSEKCKNNQQRGRGRRRRRREQLTVTAGSHFAGIFYCINLAIWICCLALALAQGTNAASTDSDNSSTNVLVAVTPSPSSSQLTSSPPIDAPLEQQQPQGQCLLDGLWVPETTVHCEKQTSCRAIQRTGHCCPDYKCDCEKDGKTYANGYKLVSPDTPCTVCYCKGGEIVCSPVTCFRRDDCQPKYVPGRCCPEYDNCPILDNNPQLGSETSSAVPATAAPTTAGAAAAAAAGAGFNWNITIKEITKPTEIRITDDNHKPKQPIPMRTPATTSAPATPTAAAAASTTTTAAATATSDAPTTTAATTEATATPAAAAATSSALSQDNNHKALPVNSSSSGSSESLKLIASVGYVERPLNHSHDSNLVIYNAAQGLQPLTENDPSKINIKREYTTEGMTGVLPSKLEIVAVASELEPDTAGSDNIYHIISTTEGPAGSSSSSTELNASSSFESSSSNNTLDSEFSTEGLPSSSSEAPAASSTPTALHHLEEEEVAQVESNPAYPSLPEDDFSLRDVNFPLVELEDIVEAENKDEQRSIVSPFEREHKLAQLVTDSPSLDASGSGMGLIMGSGSGDMELNQSLPNAPEQLQALASSQAPMSVPLMYSVEENSAETRIQNVSDVLRLERQQLENETSAELEVGSGSLERREATTPKAKRELDIDIDELGSGAGQAAQGSVAKDPKEDAESLKLNDSQEQSEGVASKTTTRAEKSFVDLSSSAGAIAGQQRLERLYLHRIY